MLLYRILFGIVAIAAAILAFFFLWGLSDGSVSADNLALWVALLTAPCVVLFFAHRLAAANNRGAASALLAVLALPATLLGLFFLMLIVLAPDWK